MESTINNLFREVAIMPNNLDAIIRASGITKKQIAKAAGVTPEALSRQIHGHANLTLQDAERYAEILSVSVQKILFVYPPIPIMGHCNYTKEGKIERTYHEPGSWNKGLQINAYQGDDLCAVHWTADDDYTGDFYEYKNAFCFFIKYPIFENKVHPGCIENVSLIKLQDEMKMPGEETMQIVGGILYPEPGKRYTVFSSKLGIEIKGLKIEWATPLVSVLHRPDLRGVTYVDIECEQSECKECNNSYSNS